MNHIFINKNTKFLYIAIGCANNVNQELPQQIINLIHDNEYNTNEIEIIHIDKALDNYTYPEFKIHKIKKFINDNSDNFPNYEDISWNDLEDFINDILLTNDKILILIEDYSGHQLYNINLNFIDDDRVQLHFLPYHTYSCYPPLDNINFNFILSSDGKDKHFIKLYKMSTKDIIKFYQKDNETHKLHFKMYVDYERSKFNNFYHFHYRNNINKIQFYKFLIWLDELKFILGDITINIEQNEISKINSFLNEFIKR